MPYDPRPISEGGNRGIDTAFSRKAPKGKFRVVCIDTFDGTDWIKGDYKSFGAAIQTAIASSGKMLKAYVYSDKGSCLSHYGGF